MPQPLANGRQTDAPVDEFSCVRVPKLVERAGNTCLRAVVVPALLHRLVAQRSASPVLLRAKERSMLVVRVFHVGSQLMHQARIVEQNRSPLAAFPYDGQVFIVE